MILLIFNKTCVHLYVTFKHCFLFINGIYIHLVYVLKVLAVLIMDVVPTLKEE